VPYFCSPTFLLLVRYVPNEIWDQCKKYEYWWPTDDQRLTDLRAHSLILGKFQMAITLQRVIRSLSCLVLGWSFRGWRTERRHFRLDQIQDGSRQPSWKTSNGQISEMHYLIQCIYVHRPYFALRLVSIIMEIQNLFHKGGSLADLQYKEKKRKGRSCEIVEKITCKEYTLDWWQSEVFLFYSWNYSIFFFSVILCFVWSVVRLLWFSHASSSKIPESLPRCHFRQIRRNWRRNCQEF